MTVMDTHISSRKDDHLRLAQQFHSESMSRPENHNEIDAMQFVPRALPETNRNDVSIATTWAGLDVCRPFFINAMTGGTRLAQSINRRLARVAQETTMPMALGSMSIAVKNPDVRDDYARLRDDFPDVRFIANLGAEHSAHNARFVRDLIDAVAVQIHVNAVQEIVMPEGEKDFTGWARNIRDCVDELDVPVIVKEVGFGLSYESVQQLAQLGVNTVDTAGRGGTNFVRIENARNNSHDFGYLEDWGMTTIRSVMEAVRARHDMQAHDDPRAEGLEIIASGGVRGPLDIVRYCALGADTVGLSGAFLQSVTSSDNDDEAVDHTIELVHEWDEHIANIMTILGVTSVGELHSRAAYTLPQSVLSYMQQRFGSER